MTNAQKIFDMAMSLMDEVREDGTTDSPDTKEYKNRTLLILNTLRGELYRYSDTFDPNGEIGRPIAAYIKDFTSAIDLDDFICQSILPYGLAAHLLVDENPSVASFFNQRYEELKQELKRGMPAQYEQIEDVYGGIEYGQFGRW